MRLAITILSIIAAWQQVTIWRGHHDLSQREQKIERLQATVDQQTEQQKQCSAGLRYWGKMALMIEQGKR